MPTVASQPSLRTTQAVGAFLLHQFARERFQEAGINDDLIQQAESMESLDHLTASFLQDEENSKSMNSSGASDLSEAPTLVNDTANCCLNTTGQDHNRGGDESNGPERYHSILSSTLATNDNTMYHSMSAEHGAQASLSHAERLPKMALYGRELRLIAEAFEKTRERRTVKERADQVQLNDINKDTFLQLLAELFKDGITRERIVVLFFFCTDVAVRAASFGQELVVRLMRWSFSYIINTVCKIVHELGGWETIMFRQLGNILLNCFAIIGVFAVVSFYFLKFSTLRSS